LVVLQERGKGKMRPFVENRSFQHFLGAICIPESSSGLRREEVVSELSLIAVVKAL
jgi:hypothetical protein